MIKDDDMLVHELVMMALYVPSSPHRLLCTHHWYKPVKENYPDKHGTGCSNFDDVCELFYYQCQYKRTITWDPKTNIAIIRSDPGFKNFHIYAATVGADQHFEHNNFCMKTLHIIPQDQ